jgi:hypothetical protein
MAGLDAVAEGINPYHCRESNSRLQARSLDTIPTELSQFPLNVRILDLVVVFSVPPHKVTELPQ